MSMFYSENQWFNRDVLTVVYELWVLFVICLFETCLGFSSDGGSFGLTDDGSGFIYKMEREDL